MYSEASGCMGCGSCESERPCGGGIALLRKVCDFTY